MSIKKLLLFAVPTLLIVIVFRKFIFGGQIPIPGDILIGGYYPWLDSIWGFPVSVPVKNSLPSDIISIIYPWRILGINILKSGHLPLWDDTILLGAPLLANFQAALLNPVNILFFVVNHLTAWGIQIILQPIISIIGMFMFLKAKKLSSYASVFGAMLYAFSGFSIVWLEYNSIGYTLALIPFIFWAIEKKRMFLLSIFVCLQVFSGYPQIVIYTLIFAFLYKRTVSTILGLTSGLLLSAVQLIPAYEMSRLSIRAFDTVAQAASIKNLPITHIITFFIPDFYGNPTTANYWSAGSYDNFAFYISSVGVFFLLTALVSKMAFKKDLAIFTLFAGASLLFALVEIPFLTSASVSTRILSIFTFAVSILSAFSFEAFLSGKLKPRFKLVPFIIYTSAVLLVLVSLALLRSLNSSEYAQFYTAFRNTAIPAITILAITIFVYLPLKSKPLKFSILSILLVLSIKLSTDKYLSFTPRDLVFPATPVTDKLNKLTTNHRFDREQAEILPANTWSAYGIRGIEGQLTTAPLSTARLFNQINTKSDKDEILTRFLEVKDPLDPSYNQLDIQYFVALDRDPETSITSEAGRPYPWIIPEWFEEVDNIGSVRIYKNTRNLGSAWVTPFPYPDLSVFPSSADVINKTSNGLAVKANTPLDSYLTASIALYPGWKARLDGQQVPIIVNNETFLTVELPQGEHIVEFYFDPDIVKYSAAISVITLFIWLLYLVRRAKRGML